jgi:hypothetical protein
MRLWPKTAAITAALIFASTTVEANIVAVPNNIDTVDCDTFETGGRVDPGDILELAAGNRGPLQIRDCHGTSSLPITVRNNTSGGTSTNIRRTGTGESYVFRIENVTHVVVDGTGKWSGAPAGKCGYNPVTKAEGKNNCGIVIENTITNHPTHYLRIAGRLTQHLTIRGLEVDGSTGSGGGSGILVSLNDHDFKNDDHPGVWREDITLENLYVHHSEGTTGECMYIGPNAYDDDLPLRNITIRDNLVQFCARNGIELKYSLSGASEISGNVVRNVGLSGEAGQMGGISVIDGGDIDIHANIVEEPGSNAIGCNNQNAVIDGAGAEPDTGPWYCHIYNNIAIRAGAVGGGPGVNVARCVSTSGGCAGSHTGTRAQLDPVSVYNNTVINPTGGGCVNSSGLSGSKVARDNICAAATAQTREVSGLTDTNNRKGTVATMDFVNPGADNYELTFDSPACNNAQNQSLATDYEDEARPQDGKSDQGADEAGACPTFSPFPQVAGQQTSSTDTNSTSQLVTLPSSRVIGNLLVCGLTIDGGPTSTWPVGWNEIADAANGAQVALTIGWRIIDGSEGSTISVVTSASEQSIAHCWQISNHDPGIAPQAAVPATNFSGTPNPPSLTPSGGANDYLWLAIVGIQNGSNSITGFPTNYTGTGASAGGASPADQAPQGWARRVLNASSENASAFTSSTDSVWIAGTVAVHPNSP